MKWKSLRSRFIALVLLSLVLPFSLVLAFSYWSTSRITRGFAETDLRESLSRFLYAIPMVRDQAAGAVQLMLASTSASGHAIAHARIRHRIYQEKLQSNLREFLTNRWNMFDSAISIDRAGGPQARFVWGWAGGLESSHAVYVETKWFSPEDSNWATHLRPLQRDEVWLLPPAISKAGYVQPIELPLSIELEPANRIEVLGSLFVNFRLDYLFNEAAARAQVSADQFPIVFDSSGTILFDSRRENISQKLSVMCPELAAGLQDPPRLVGDISLFEHSGWFLAYARQEHWIAGIASHQPALLAKPRRIYLINGATIVLTLLLAVAMITISTRRVSRSVAEVASGAQAIAKGELEKKLPVRTEDEIGSLARAFNSMADSLRAMIEERVEKEKLREMNELKSAFVANVSHELRQPLSHILIAVENLRKGIGGRTSAKQRDYLDRVRGNTMALLHMINELLDLSRIEAGRLRLDLSTVSLDSVVADVIDETRHLWHQKHLEVEYRNAEAALSLQGDAEKVKEIIGNLVDNAIKYTPCGGKVTVSSSREDGRAKILVEDTGIGIPAEHLHHVFDRFYQVRDHRLERNPGLGLGLNIVKTLVELHGGTVHIESQVEKGTKVAVRLPLAQGKTLCNW